MSYDVAIQVENLSKCYHIYDKPRDRLLQMLARGRKQYFREFWALKNVSFDIKKGETVGIVGRNGSGKSTLLQMICGTINPTSGSILTNGRIAALLELGSGFNPEFTGRENVFLNGSIHGISAERMLDKFDAVAEFADIGDFIDQPVKTYSSGMYARLAFAASMSIEPDILIVDEILAVGDAPFQAKCMRAFHKLRDDGCSIILVSHDSYTVKNFCQRALYLRRGEFISFGESSETVDLYNLEVEKAQSDDKESRLNHNAGSNQSGDVSGNALFRITAVELLDSDRNQVTTIKTGDDIILGFEFSSSQTQAQKVTFVVNLYRHDDLYICGTTSLMDHQPPSIIGSEGRVEVTFPNIQLLAGKYTWRVAINDEHAFGIYAEATKVCSFEIKDNLEAVGIFNLERHWYITDHKE